MVALYVGTVNEDDIWEMTYRFYNDVLRELSVMLQYQAIVNLYGNAFAGEDGHAAISEANPMKYKFEKDQPKRVTMETLIQSGLFD